MPLRIRRRIAECRTAEVWALDPGGGPMRHYVTETELLEVLNLRLEAAGMPADFRFHEPIRPLSYQDADGCNWTRLVAISNIQQYPPIYRQVASLIVSEVAREYSVLGAMCPESTAP